MESPKPITLFPPASGIPHTLSSMQLFTLSALAPSLAVVFTNPFDTAKVRLQLDGERVRKAAAGTATRTYKNSWDCMTKTFKLEGIKGLQKGLLPAIYREGSKNWFRIGAYDPLINLLHPKSSPGPAPLWKKVIAGSVCGAIGAVACNPFELVKTRLQSQANANIAVGHQHGYNGVWDGLVKIFRKEGFLGLYRGSGMSMARSIVGSGTNLPAFSTSKDYALSQGVQDSVWLDMACGLWSSLFSVILMNPIDVLRTRYYNQPYGPDGRGTLYSSAADMVRKVLRDEGFSALYKGFLSHFLRLGPHFCLTFTFLGIFRRSMLAYYDRKDMYASFREIDIDKNGKISVDELKQALRRSIAMTEEYLTGRVPENSVLKSPVISDSLVDTYSRRLIESCGGEVDFNSFRKLLAEVKGVLQEIKVRESFALFDIDRNGTIDKNELSRVLKDTVAKHPMMTEEQFNDIVKKLIDYAAPGSSVVQLHQFARLCEGIEDVQRAKVLDRWAQFAGIRLLS